jgi:predicted transcriptional regulator
MTDQLLHNDIAQYLDRVLMTEAWEESGEEAASRVISLVEEAGWRPIDRGYKGVAAVITALPRLLRQRRLERNLSLRMAAREIGCSSATVRRIESSGHLTLTVALKVLDWLDRTTEPDAA